MNNMKDYHDLYLNADVLSLTCAFETFRKESINSFELNPGHFCLLLVIAGTRW